MKKETKIIIILSVLMSIFIIFAIVLLFVYFFVIKKKKKNNDSSSSSSENIPDEFNLLSVIGAIVIVQNGGTGIGTIPQDFIPVGGNGGGSSVNAFINRPPGNFVGITDIQTIDNTTILSNNTIQNGIQVTGTGNNYTFNMPTNTNFVIRDISNTDLIDFSELSAVPRVFFRSTDTFISNTGGLRFQWAKNDPNYVDRPLRSFPFSSSNTINGNLTVNGFGNVNTNSIVLNVIKYGKSVTVTYTNIQFSFSNNSLSTNFSTQASIAFKTNFSTNILMGTIVRITTTNGTPNDIFGQVTLGVGNAIISFSSIVFSPSVVVTMNFSPITYSFYQNLNE
jgi:hypothetical protein